MRFSTVTRSLTLAALCALLANPAFGQALMERIDRICILDEDTIDNGLLVFEELANAGCGGGQSDVCVNDQLADPGVRIPLPIPVGTIIGMDAPGGTTNVLPTGQIGDEGIFILANAPASWDAAGPTPDGLANYILGTADGFGMNGEHLLDEIPQVMPLGHAGLKELVGQSCCAVVYDSDVSIISQNPPEANLQGANLGILAFTVLSVGTDPPGSVLPPITIRVDDPRNCQLPALPTEKGSWGAVKALFSLDR